jgi:hypothetical protein
MHLDPYSSTTDEDSAFILSPEDFAWVRTAWQSHLDEPEFILRASTTREVMDANIYAWYMSRPIHVTRKQPPHDPTELAQLFPLLANSVPG